MCSNKGYNFKTGIDQPYDVVYHIEDKPQRIKQALYEYPEDNIGRNVIDGVTQNNIYEGFVSPETTKHFPHLEMKQVEW